MIRRRLIHIFRRLFGLGHAHALLEARGIGPQSERNLDLGRQALRSEHWEWMAGMAAVDSVGTGGRLRVTVGTTVPMGWIPDFDDPATVGCLAARVQALWACDESKMICVERDFESEPPLGSIAPLWRITARRRLRTLNDPDTTWPEWSTVERSPFFFYRRRRKRRVPSEWRFSISALSSATRSTTTTYYGSDVAAFVQLLIVAPSPAKTDAAPPASNVPVMSP
jgi:hypothetical protein